MHAPTGVHALALLPACAFMAGALYGISFDVPSSLVWFPPFTVAAAIVLHAARRRLVVLMAIASGIAVCAALLAADARDRALHPTIRTLLDEHFGGFRIEALGPGGSHDPVRLRGVLLEDAAPRPDAVLLAVRADSLLLADRWVTVDGNVMLSVTGSASGEYMDDWRAGRTIEAPVLFRRPSRFLNDGVPDFERALALDGTALFGSIKSGLLVTVTAHGNWLEERAADVRAFVRRAIHGWVATRDEVSAAVVSAILIGDRTGLPQEVRERLQRAGTYHVIAISGGNIAMFAALTWAVLALCLVQTRVAGVLTAVVLICYGGLVVAGPSVWRATLTAVLCLSARVLDHRTSAWHAAAFAALVIVAWHPPDVRSVGFMLTFGATVALLVVARWTRRGAIRSLPLRWLCASVFASAAIDIVLMPVFATTFSRITAAGIVLNLLAVPLMAVVQVAGMGVVLLERAGLPAAVLGWLAHSAAWSLVESARLVDVAPWLTRRMPPPALSLVVAYYGGLAVMHLPRWQARACGAAVAVACGLAMLWGFDPAGLNKHPPAPDLLTLTMLDVGQSESMLLQLPGGGGPLLVDTGGAPFASGGLDIGGRVIAPALWKLGVRRLGTLLITHGDPDHLGGAPAVVEDFSPARLWTGIAVPSHVPSRDLVQAALEVGARQEERRDGEALASGRVRLRILNPPPPDWERRRVRNDDSVVIEVLYGNVALLLTGDIGADVERAIVPRLTPAAVRVLKVAHHGSRTSSSRELLETWRPQFALVSCGRGNTFGHPAPDVVARLESIGAAIYRTDRHGQITVTTDGRTVRVRTFIAPVP